MKQTYLIILTALILASCGGDNKSVEDVIESGNLEQIKAKREQVNAEHDALSADLKALNQAVKKLDTTKNYALVTTFVAKDSLFNHYIELQGSVSTKENIIINAEYSGALQQVLVKEGQEVRKGQVLARIDEGGLGAQLAQLKAQESLSQTTYERQKRLWEQNIGSEIQYLQAETQYESNKSAVSQLESQLAKATVVAPFSGTIEEIMSDQGSNVSMGTPLMRIVSLSNMYIESEVPEKYLASIEKGTKVIADFPVINKKIDTEIRQVSNYINPNNRSFKIEVGVPNKDGLIKPNLTAKVVINDYTSENAFLIPQSVISENSEGNQYVYIATNINGSNEAEVHQSIIQTGKTQGDLVEILEGIKAGDHIIKEGARSVQEGQNVQILKQ
ncbi:efflux RND transporter periplasmic adaptor subunit [Joostella atrarenae]|uniref:Efflux RND transporter periplasmic adaptor subunit n=1 Tax=Joostella atrarenae TaxID=679257 RepID=A0ABS9IZ19_9FLAO|nr:efflux RND transporter periplasmic adaptor subunit [Joostella atrarenae]MCF8713423.1 efflux RND transporter periplasmic adaptor subunit [Joostella atrarenae]